MSSRLQVGTQLVCEYVSNVAHLFRLQPRVIIQENSDEIAGCDSGGHNVIPLQDTLPVVSVPLLEPDPDAPLDLSAAVAAVYERGGYADLIDYRWPPPPPKLSEAEAIWLDERLQEQEVR